MESSLLKQKIRNLNNQFSKPISLKSLWWFDALVLVIIILLALLCFFGQWKGSVPYVYLRGDASNIASWVAGRTYPELFQNDYVLSDLDNYRYYYTVYFPILQVLKNVVGDFGTASIVLYAPLIILQGIGFYLLGAEIFQHRIWGALLSGLNMLTFYMNLGTLWGIAFDDVVPRFMFQALLPYILLCAIIWRHNPKRWPWVMVFAGLMVYVHSVSTLTWGFGIWLGLWLFPPKEWSKIKKMRQMTFLGLVFLATILPFAISYLSNHAYGETIEYELVHSLMAGRYSPGALDLSRAFGDFLIILFDRETIFTLTGLIGIPISLRPEAPESRQKFRLIVAWFMGLLIVAVVVPLIDHGISNMNDRLPYQVDLTRNLRYVFLFLSIFALGGIREMAHWLNNIDGNLPRNSDLVSPLLGGLFLFWMIQFHLPIFATNSWNCIVEGDLFCPRENKELQKLDILDAIKRETPEGAKIMPMDLQMEVRYYALRPIIFAQRDIGVLSYTNPERLLLWHEKAQEINQIKDLSDKDIKTEKLIDFARRYGAEYVLVNWDLPEKTPILAGAELVYSNPPYALIMISQK